MKTLKKLLLLSSILIITVNIGSAQTKKLNIGLGFGSTLYINEIPTANFDFPYDIYTGLNFYANILYKFDQTISTGMKYNLVLPSDFDINSSSFGFKNLSGYLAKIKYSFKGVGVRMYLAFLPGIYRFNYNKYSNNYYSKIKTHESAFGFASQFGFRINTFQINTSFHLPRVSAKRNSYNLLPVYLLNIDIG